MIIRISLTILAVLCVMQCSAQKTQVTYYDSKYKEVSEDKAHYVQTVIVNNDSSTTTKGMEQYGIWDSKSYGKGAKNKKLDYNFKLIYDSSISCVVGPELISVQDYLKDDDELGYKAPQAKGSNNFNHYLAMNIRYPAPAKEQGLQGRVVAAFTVTKEGEVQNIRIKETAHICLDKEYVRVLRGLKFDKPPMLNGKAVEVCVTAPASFKLE